LRAAFSAAVLRANSTCFFVGLRIVILFLSELSLIHI